MNHKTKTMLWMLGLLLILLAIRLGFFLRDGTSDTVESFLIWVIFIGSLGLFIYSFLFPLSYIHYRWKPQLPTVIVGAAVLVMDIGFVVKNGLSVDMTYFFSSVSILYLLFMLASFLKPRGKSVMNAVILLVASLYLFVQDLYFQVFGDFFSFKEGGTLREGVESAESMIHLSWYQGFLVSTVILIYALIRKLPKTPVVKYSLSSKLASIFLLLALINLNADYPVKMARLHTSDHYLYTSVFSRKAFVENYGTMNLIIRDLTQTFRPDLSTRRNKDYLDDHFESTIDTHVSNDYTGVFRDKNLVYIVGESFDDLVVNETLTPHLYKLKHEGWDFKNHYVPVFPRTTCDGEIIMNTGLIPSIEDGPTCYTYNENSYETSLANQFKSVGYYTQAFHNNYKEFYTRDLVYEGFGYDALYGQHELGLTETDKRYDSQLAKQSKDIIIPEDNGFLSFVLTLSGHSPYTDTNLAAREHYDAVDDYHGESMDRELKYYIASQMELDRLVGRLLDDLKEKDKLKDTVILLTTDHYPYTLDQTLYETRTGVEAEYEKAHAPLYIYMEGMTPMEVNSLTTSFDILPTLMNLWAIESDYRYYVGNDVFSDTDSMVYYKDYSVFTGDAYFHLSDSIPEALTPSYQRAFMNYELSKRILRSDYLETD